MKKFIGGFAVLALAVSFAPKAHAQYAPQGYYGGYGQQSYQQPYQGQDPYRQRNYWWYPTVPPVPNYPIWYWYPCPPMPYGRWH